MSRKNDKFSPFGQKIKQALKDQRITIVDLCKEMSISRSTLYSWMKGITDPTHPELQTLYKILNISEHQTADKPFWDEIREGEYIGMHQKVWAQHEITMNKQRKWIDKLINKLVKLPQAGDGQ